MIRFTVPGLPIAQPRQRHRVVTSGGRTFASNYTPKTAPVNSFKAAVRLACAAAHTGQPLEGPLVLTVVFVFPRPSALRWKSREMPRQYHAKKPDVDNLVKSLKDALKSLAWSDDSQVAIVRASKLIASGDEQSRTMVEICRLNVVGGEGLGFERPGS